MGDVDLDCGNADCNCDCGGCDGCDCKCDGCDFGCNCDGGDCCDCNCFDCFPVGGLGGGPGGSSNNTILCCCLFPSSNSGQIPGRNKRTNDIPSGLSPFCGCCYTSDDERRHTSRNPSITSKKKKRKGFCSRLWSCFRKDKNSESSSSPSPNRDQPKMESVTPMAYNYKQDGRYPMDEDDKLDLPPWERTRGAKQEELNMADRNYKLHGKWSSPIKYAENDDRNQKT